MVVVNEIKEFNQKNISQKLWLQVFLCNTHWSFTKKKKERKEETKKEKRYIYWTYSEFRLIDDRKGTEQGYSDIEYAK